MLLDYRHTTTINIDSKWLTFTSNEKESLGKFLRGFHLFIKYMVKRKEEKTKKLNKYYNNIVLDLSV
jgi:hypothetical protein